MKRIGFLFAAVLAVAFIGACSDEESDSTPSSSSKTSSVTSAPASTSQQTQSTSQQTQSASPAPGLPGSDTSDCEGTVCTNPNHGAGPNPDENGGAVMPNPNGDGSQVPCEGTVCTNPNHGAGG